MAFVVTYDAVTARTPSGLGGPVTPVVEYNDNGEALFLVQVRPWPNSSSAHRSLVKLTGRVVPGGAMAAQVSLQMNRADLRAFAVRLLAACDGMPG